MATAADVAPVPSLSRRLSGAALWVVFGAGASHIVRLAGNLVVTRFLAPEIFGLVAIAGLIPMILSMISDIGFRENVCRNPRGEDRLFLDTLWTVQIVRGCMLWSGCVVVSILLYLAGQEHWFSAGSTYGDPRLPWVIAASSISIVISSFHSTKIFTESRHFQIKRVLRLELVTQVLGIVVMVALAYAMGSVWAIVIGSLASSAIYVIFTHTWLPGTNNRIAWDKESVVDVMTFGKWLLWSSALTVLSSNGDKILLGGLTTPQVLGIYSIAINLAGAVELLVNQLLARVAMPGFSEVVRTSPERLPQAFWRLRSRFDPIMLALSGLLFATGHLIIGALYDGRYHDAGPMLEILALGLVASRYTLSQSAYLSLNRPQYQVMLNLVRCVTIYIGLFAAYSWFGMMGAVFVIALRELAVVPLIFFYNARHGLNDFILEAKLLLVWPAAFLIGEAIVLLHDRIRLAF